MDYQELKQVPIFASCGEAELERLLESPHKVSTFQPGETMVRFGTPCRSLLLLTEGIVETRMGSIEGRELVVDKMKAPCVLAPAFLFGTNDIIPVEVTALSEATLWQINREAFLAFMQRNPEVLRAFLKLISDRAQFLSGKVRSFAIKGLRNRALEYIVLHGGLSNVAQAAEMLGIARPSLSRILSELVEEGVIRKENNKYVKI
ncbi:MAG: Crp/Fnr family transcriptional regulator [Bacteroidales bacterium]|nr:Crp/Fnr family transcriptional regulator [Bacteroidales bacterium]